ncbi:hypothetical protein D3C87_2204220 [compost metagenome]
MGVLSLAAETAGALESSFELNLFNMPDTNKVIDSATEAGVSSAICQYSIG